MIIEHVHSKKTFLENKVGEGLSLVKQVGVNKGDTGKRGKHNWDAPEVEGHDFRSFMGLNVPEIAPECPWTRCPKLPSGKLT